uniref:type IV secretion system protein n=1 Tax=Haloprofundus sp. MHR1 TaxID=2572921 RepID=UPI001F37C649|nr:type IV secretion system protein [Haloprofundus sp. MHR1]
MVSVGVVPPLVNGQSSPTERSQLGTPSDPTPDRGTEQSNNSTNESTGYCSGIDPVSGQVCNGFIDAIRAIAQGFLEFARDIAEWAVEFLVSRPVPLQDGEMELVERPTNAPMDAAYELWLTKGLPIGLALWGFAMTILRFTTILPMGAASAHRGKTLRQKGWFGLFFILGSWIWAAVVLHLSQGMILAVAPDGADLVADFGSIGGNSAAAGLGIILVWLSSGVLFLLIAFVFGLTWVSVFIFAPALPVFIALSLVDFGPLSVVSRIGKFGRDLFVTVAFLPFPTALVLGFGYPIVNAARAAMPGPAEIVPGLGVYALLTLCLWVIALLSPLVLFIGMRSMRPLAYMTAGILGAVSMSSLASSSNKVGKAGNAATSAASSVKTNPRVDPLKGSPFSRDSEGSTNVGSVTETRSVSALESSDGLVQSRSSVATRLGASSTSQASETSRQSFSNSRIPSGVSLNEVATRSELDSEQEYRTGYFLPNGDFKGVGGTSSNRDWTLDTGYERLEKVFPEETLVLQGADDEQFYDVREIVNSEQYRGPYSYAQQTAESRETVFNTRGQNE